MKFSRHDNFVNLPFWPILAPNPCILWPFKADNVSPYPLGYPAREIRKKFMHVNISCYTAYINHDIYNLIKTSLNHKDEAHVAHLHLDSRQSFYVAKHDLLSTLNCISKDDEILKEFSQA